MQQWPEPVIHVQSLSESGDRAIPERFIKPPSERVTAHQGPEKTMSIPIIDIGGIANGNKFDEETMRALSNACKEWGFFQLVNHGMNKEIIEKAKEVWREFFHLPMIEKQAFANSPVTYEGYGSRVGVEKNASLDWSDYFFLNIFPKNLRNYEKWPSFPNSLRETTKNYTKEVVKLCMMLMEMLSLGLGLDKEYFREAFGGDEYGACLRACFYPKCPQPELTLGLSSHSDPGGLTVLLSDDHVTGLQVRKDGEWVTVKPVPGALIINIGDQIQVMSNDIYKSAEHRVQVNSEKERLSIALFFNPKGDIQLGRLNSFCLHISLLFSSITLLSMNIGNS
ncbi:Leucocyanidin oxygenase protein [Dioscorea alata]|uniref:Leucocyanidin oxygenase protein n=1 Tax=Dioscorea alata TaxID=55571 RepID=A0ACB7U955_DIOAL|nr:Leucocyanidin oxygenase protein [Dioscorea alata]